MSWFNWLLAHSLRQKLGFWSVSGDLIKLSFPIYQRWNICLFLLWSIILSVASSVLFPKNSACCCCLPILYPHLGHGWQQHPVGLLAQACASLSELIVTLSGVLPAGMCTPWKLVHTATKTFFFFLERQLLNIY